MADDILRDRIARALSTQTTCDGEPYPTELHYRQADAVLAVLAESTEFEPDSPEACAYFTGYQDGYSAADAEVRQQIARAVEAWETESEGDVLKHGAWSDGVRFGLAVLEGAIQEGGNR